MSDAGDYDWVLKHLNKFVEEARPQDLSGTVGYSPYKEAAYGRDEALRQLEILPLFFNFQ